MALEHPVFTTRHARDMIREMEELAAAKHPDFELLHSMEDQLHRDVLVSIARHSQDSNSRRIAAAALKSTEIKFARLMA